MRKLFRKCDKPLLITMLFFTILGLLMVFSSSSIISSFSDKVSPYYYFYRQLLFAISGYVFGLIIINVKLDKYNKYMKLGLLFTFVALIGLFLFAPEINGSKSWYDLKLFNFQPSELVKIFVIIYLAYFFDNYQKKSFKKPNKNFIYPLIICSFIVFLVFLQPDLGTSMIITALVMIIYFFVPLEKKNKIILYKLGALLGALLLILFIFKIDIVTDKQRERFNYKQPCSRYIDSTGYQLCNSFIALNNGGLFGVGLGNSTQKYLYLPAAHTDFIFSIIVEELGSIIGVIMIGTYIYMLYRMYLIAKKAEKLRDSIIAFGVLVLFALHIIINLSGIIGLLPLTGVPLPFLSYGGSFTIATYIMMFLVQRVAIENNQNKLKKEIKEI